MVFVNKTRLTISIKIIFIKKNLRNQGVIFTTPNSIFHFFPSELLEIRAIHTNITQSFRQQSSSSVLVFTEAHGEINLRSLQAPVSDGGCKSRREDHVHIQEKYNFSHVQWNERATLIQSFDATKGSSLSAVHEWNT